VKPKLHLQDQGQAPQGRERQDKWQQSTSQEEAQAHPRASVYTRRRPTSTAAQSYKERRLAKPTQVSHSAYTALPTRYPLVQAQVESEVPTSPPTSASGEATSSLASKKKQEPTSATTVKHKTVNQEEQEKKRDKLVKQQDKDYCPQAQDQGTTPEHKKCKPTQKKEVQVQVLLQVLHKVQVLHQGTRDTSDTKAHEGSKPHLKGLKTVTRALLKTPTTPRAQGHKWSARHIPSRPRDHHTRRLPSTSVPTLMRIWERPPSEKTNIKPQWWCERMRRLQLHRFHNSDVVYPPTVYPRYQTTPAESVGSTSAPPPSASASEEVTSGPDTITKA
jgi:hypothetical protein